MSTSFRIATVLALVLWSPACRQTASPRSDAAVVADSPTQGTAEQAGPAAGAVPCNDGTGADDCCPKTEDAGACSPEGLNCWTPCNFPTPEAKEGTRSQRMCSNRQWIAGHGLFPCTRGAP